MGVRAAQCATYHVGCAKGLAALRVLEEDIVKDVITGTVQIVQVYAPIRVVTDVVHVSLV